MRTIADIQTEMQAVVDAAEAENRALNDDEVTRYEGLESELKAVQKTEEVRSRNAAYSRIAVPAVISASPKGDAALEFAFESYLRTGQVNMDMAELRSQSTSNTEGGYMVPEGFRNKIVDTRKAFGGIRGLAEVITTSSGNPLPWPTLDDTANKGEIVAEGQTIANGSDLVFGTHSLGAYKFMAGGAGNTPLRVSVELLQDSAFDVSGLVASKLGERLARSSAYYYAIGVDTTEPGGLFHSPADVQLASASAYPTYADLLDTVHGVDPAYRTVAAWVMNDQTLKLVRGLTDTTGRPLWTPADAASIATLPGGLLLGYPVVIDQNAPAFSSTATDDIGGSPTAGEAFIAFGNIREAFVIRDVKDVTLIVDPYGRAAYGEVQFIAWARGDSTIQNRSAYSLLQGYHA